MVKLHIYPLNRILGFILEKYKYFTIKNKFVHRSFSNYLMRLKQEGVFSFFNLKEQNKFTEHSLTISSIIKIKEDSIASSSWDSNIIIWNIESLVPTMILKGKYGKIFCLCKLTNEIILSAGNSKTINFWNFNSGELVKTLYVLSKMISCIAKLSDQLFCCGEDSKISLWNIHTYEHMYSFDHKSSIESLILLSDRLFASGSNDRTIKIWKIGSNYSIKTFQAHLKEIYCMIRIDDKQLISGSQDETIKLWNVDKGLKRIFSGNQGAVLCLEKLNDFLIASGGSDKSIRILNIISGEQVCKFKAHNLRITWILKFSEKILISGSDDSLVKLWKR